MLHTRTLLCILLVVLCYCNAQILRVKHHSYADLLVGDSPGRLLTLLIRWDLDNSYLFSTPNVYSKTWADYYNPPTISGNDLAYIGNTRVRLSFVIGEPSDAVFYPSVGMQYDGVLGFGLGSEVWRVWTSVLVSPGEIRFGEGEPTELSANFRRYTLHRPRSVASLTLAQQITYMSAQNIPDVDSAQRTGLYRPFSFALDATLHTSSSAVLENRCVKLGHDPLDCFYTFSNTSYRVIVSPSSDYSVLPPQFAAITSSYITETSGDTLLVKTFDSHSKQVWLADASTPAHKSLLVYDPSDDRYTMQSSSSGTTHYSGVTHGHDDGLVILGALAMRRFVWSYDLVSGQAAFAAECSISSVCTETIEVIEKTENTVFISSGLCMVSLWIVIAFPRYSIASTSPLKRNSGESISAYLTRGALGVHLQWFMLRDDRVRLEFVSALISSVSLAVCILELDVVHEIGVFLETPVFVSWLLLAAFLCVVAALSLFSKISNQSKAPQLCWLSIRLYLLMVLWLTVFPMAAKSPITRMLFVFLTLLVLFDSARICIAVIFLPEQSRDTHIPLMLVSGAIFGFFSTVVMSKTLETIYGSNEHSVIMGFLVAYVSIPPAALYWIVQNAVYPYKVVLKKYKETRGKK